MKELERLKKIYINENPTPWQRQAENSIKVASLNCAGLAPHYVDILSDDKLIKADILHLIETSLEKNEGNRLCIPGYKYRFINVSNGKEIAKFTSNELDVI